LDYAQLDTDSLIDDALDLSPYPLPRRALEYLADRLAELQPAGQQPSKYLSGGRGSAILH
jgi:hypothetical protein